MKVYKFKETEENGRKIHRLKIMVDDKYNYDVTGIEDWPCFEHGIWVMKIYDATCCELLRVRV